MILRNHNFYKISIILRRTYFFDYLIKYHPLKKKIPFPSPSFFNLILKSLIATLTNESLETSHGEIVSWAVFRASLWFEESFQRRLAFTLLRMEESSRCVETLEQQMRDTNAGIDLKIFANRCCSYTTPLTNPQPLSTGVTNTSNLLRMLDTARSSWNMNYPTHIRSSRGYIVQFARGSPVRSHHNVYRYLWFQTNYAVNDPKTHLFPRFYIYITNNLMNEQNVWILFQCFILWKYLVTNC